MVICFLAPACSTHTKKWCKYFIERGHEVHVVSFVNDSIAGANVCWIDTGAETNDGDMSKLKYLFAAPKVKKVISKIKPDIINVHYATSYGAVASIAGIGKYILSVWGTDIFEFPRKSILHNMLLRFSMLRANVVFSTSQAMADEAMMYTRKNIVITPFGVDTSVFSPSNRTRNDMRFVVGTVKTLSDTYGIDLLLQAVAKVKQYRSDIPIYVDVAGDGPQAEEYRDLAMKLHIEEIVNWRGYVTPEEVPNVWANIDVGVICSRHESFGVSAVEAQACCVPIIVSEIPGLMEASNPSYSSIVVPVEDSESIAQNIIKLYDNPNLRKQYAQEGRDYVKRKYDYIKCFNKIEDEFLAFLRRKLNG